MHISTMCWRKQIIHLLWIIVLSPHIHFQQFKLFTLSIFVIYLCLRPPPCPYSLLQKVIIQTKYSLVCSSFLSIGMAKYRLNISRYILKTSKHHDKCMIIKKNSTSPLAYHFFSQNFRFCYPFKKTSTPPPFAYPL